MHIWSCCPSSQICHCACSHWGISGPRCIQTLRKRASTSTEVVMRAYKCSFLSGPAQFVWGLDLQSQKKNKVRKTPTCYMNRMNHMSMRPVLLGVPFHLPNKRYLRASQFSSKTSLPKAKDLKWRGDFRSKVLNPQASETLLGPTILTTGGAGGLTVRLKTYSGAVAWVSDFWCYDFSTLKTLPSRKRQLIKGLKRVQYNSSRQFRCNLLTSSSSPDFQNPNSDAKSPSGSRSHTVQWRGTREWCCYRTRRQQNGWHRDVDPGPS